MRWKYHRLEKVKFRPFLVKEQKVLMIAQETGGNDKDMSQCVISS